MKNFRTRETQWAKFKQFPESYFNICVMYIRQFCRYEQICSLNHFLVNCSFQSFTNFFLIVRPKACINCSYSLLRVVTKIFYHMRTITHYLSEDQYFEAKIVKTVTFLDNIEFSHKTLTNLAPTQTSGPMKYKGGRIGLSN